MRYEPRAENIPYELGDADKQRNGKLHNGEGGSGEIVEVEEIGK